MWSDWVPLQTEVACINVFRTLFCISLIRYTYNGSNTLLFASSTWIRMRQPRQSLKEEFRSVGLISVISDWDFEISQILLRHKRRVGFTQQCFEPLQPIIDPLRLTPTHLDLEVTYILKKRYSKAKLLTNSDTLRLRHTTIDRNPSHSESLHPTLNNSELVLTHSDQQWPKTTHFDQSTTYI